MLCTRAMFITDYDIVKCLLNTTPFKDYNSNLYPSRRRRKQWIGLEQVQPNTTLVIYTIKPGIETEKVGQHLKTKQDEKQMKHIYICRAREREKKQETIRAFMKI